MVDLFRPYYCYSRRDTCAVRVVVFLAIFIITEVEAGVLKKRFEEVYGINYL